MPGPWKQNIDISLDEKQSVILRERFLDMYISYKTRISGISNKSL